VNHSAGFTGLVDHEDRRGDDGPLPNQDLSEIGCRVASHAHLGGNTQRIYQRQVGFIAAAIGAWTCRSTRDTKVLNWGCGKGHISCLLWPTGLQVRTCDLVADADDSAFGQATPVIEEQRITVVSLADPAALLFDGAASLRELRRVVRTEGLCWTSLLPYTLSWTQRLAHARGDRYHDRLYSRKGVDQLARDARFHVLGMAHGQLLPTNSVSWRAASILEPPGRWLCRHAPLRYLATNLEVMLAPV
jgi:hypothetical protein